jgi:hypothetical protein
MRVIAIEPPTYYIALTLFSFFRYQREPYAHITRCLSPTLILFFTPRPLPPTIRHYFSPLFRHEPVVISRFSHAAPPARRSSFIIDCLQSCFIMPYFIFHIFIITLIIERYEYNISSYFSYRYLAALLLSFLPLLQLYYFIYYYREEYFSLRFFLHYCWLFHMRSHGYIHVFAMPIYMPFSHYYIILSTYIMMTYDIGDNIYCCHYI